MTHMSSTEKPARSSFGEAFLVWLKIGCINFGGPAGQIALMHRILVDEKKWVEEQRYLHALESADDTALEAFQRTRNRDPSRPSISRSEALPPIELIRPDPPCI